MPGDPMQMMAGSGGVLQLVFGNLLLELKHYCVCNVVVLQGKPSATVRGAMTDSNHP